MGLEESIHLREKKNKHSEIELRGIGNTSSITPASSSAPASSPLGSSSSLASSMANVCLSCVAAVTALRRLGTCVDDKLKSDATVTSEAVEDDFRNDGVEVDLGTLLLEEDNNDSHAFGSCRPLALPMDGRWTTWEEGFMNSRCDELNDKPDVSQWFCQLRLKTC